MDIELEKIRNKLDELDTKLIQILAERFKCICEIGEYKKQNSIPMMQPGRVKFVIEKAKRLGGELGIDPLFVENLYALIIDEACRVETILIDRRK